MRLITLSFMLFATGCASAAEAQQRSPDSQAAAVHRKIRSMMVDGRTLLHVDEAARSTGWQAKEVTRDKLLVFCQEQDSSVCVPIRLSRVVYRRLDEAIFLDGQVLASAIGHQLTADQQLRPAAPPAPAAAKAYNASWPTGRGFGVGDTLPDIPLLDMNGGERRFSDYLGKRYVIYCWASW